MKLSITTKLRTALNALSVPKGVRLEKATPLVIHPDYLQGWKDFLGTTVVREFRQSKLPTEMIKYLAAASFVSTLISVDKDATTKKVDLVGMSLDLYNPLDFYRTIKEYVHRKRLVDGLRLHSHNFVLEHQNNDFIRALVHPKCTGVFEFKVTGRNTLDGSLSKLVPTLFRTLPVPLSARMPNGKARKFKTVVQQLNSKADWVLLLNQDGLTLEVARTKFSTLILRYTFQTDDVLFYGRESAQGLEAKLQKLHASKVIVP